MFDFWLAAAAMTLVAVAFLLVPQWREWQRSGKKAIVGPLAAVVVAPVAFGLYLAVSNYDPDIPTGPSHDDMALLQQLADRLERDPSDVGGWVLLGRSYIQLGDYERARQALEQAWNRSDEHDDALKLAYAQTMLFTQEGAAAGLAGDLVEQVLTTSPQNEAALLWGGFVAAERNQPGVAAQRWTDLLATNPPPNVAELIRSQLALLAGATGVEVPAPATSPAPQAATPAAAAASGPVIEVDVRVADGIDLSHFGPNAQFFVIARASDSPAPLAVERHPLSALPGKFSLSDADAMIPGRSLSQYDEVTVVARISGSGQPIEASGDAYAETTTNPASGEPLSLVIDQVVP